MGLCLCGADVDRSSRYDPICYGYLCQMTRLIDVNYRRIICDIWDNQANHWDGPPQPLRPPRPNSYQTRDDAFFKCSENNALPQFHWDNFFLFNITSWRKKWQISFIKPAEYYLFILICWIEFSIQVKILRDAVNWSLAIGPVFVQQNDNIWSLFVTCQWPWIPCFEHIRVQTIGTWWKCSGFKSARYWCGWPVSLTDETNFWLSFYFHNITFTLRWNNSKYKYHKYALPQSQKTLC